MMYVVLAAFAGLLSGTIGALVGAGGGFIIMPFLLLIVGLEPPVAVGTSLCAVLTTASSGSIAFARQKRIQYRTGVIMTIGIIPGSLIGKQLATRMEPDAYQIVFGLLMGVAAAVMIRRALKKPAAEKQEQGEADQTIRFHIPISILSGLVAGFMAASFGIGGGLVLVPILIIVMRMPVHLATATALFVMIFTSASGILNHALEHGIEVKLALALMGGVLVGSQIGARLSQKIKARPLTYAVASGVTLLAILMIFRGSHALLTG